MHSSNIKVDIDNHNLDTTMNVMNVQKCKDINIDLSPSNKPKLFCEHVKELSNALPENIQKTLQNFVIHGTISGFLLFKLNNLINETIPDTPPNNNYKVGEKLTLSKMQAILLSFISNIVSYEAEGYGRIFQDIVPDIKMSDQQSSVGSSKELEIHTEQAFSKLKPDFLSLSCIRGDYNAFTYILPVHIILSNLDEYDRELVRQPLWTIGVDYSFKLNGNEFIEGNIRGPIPIISGTEEDPILVFDQDLMIGTTIEANEIIKKITDIYYQHRIKHCLQAGEIIIIDNRRAVHGRSCFAPLYNGKDRFLVRCFGMLDDNYNKTSFARPNDDVMFSAIYS
jgi:L-asparagine oxygenase